MAPPPPGGHDKGKREAQEGGETGKVVHKAVSIPHSGWRPPLRAAARARRGPADAGWNVSNPGNCGIIQGDLRRDERGFGGGCLATE
jgi:hypothetical protein